MIWGGWGRYINKIVHDLWNEIKFESSLTEYCLRTYFLESIASSRIQRKLVMLAVPQNTCQFRYAPWAQCFPGALSHLCQGNKGSFCLLVKNVLWAGHNMLIPSRFEVHTLQELTEAYQSLVTISNLDCSFIVQCLSLNQTFSAVKVLMDDSAKWQRLQEAWYCVPGEGFCWPGGHKLENQPQELMKPWENLHLLNFSSTVKHFY